MEWIAGGARNPARSRTGLVDGIARSATGFDHAALQGIGQSAVEFARSLAKHGEMHDILGSQFSWSASTSLTGGSMPAAAEAWSLPSIAGRVDVPAAAVAPLASDFYTPGEVVFVNPPAGKGDLQPQTTQS